MKHVHTAANHSRPEDNFTKVFRDQNARQFWLPEEISLTGDVTVWKSLTDEERNTYAKVLAGLTMLDTIQGDVGVPQLARYVEGHQRKALLNFMAMAENFIHAPSYSIIYQTLITTKEIDELFSWVEGDKFLQRKGDLIREYYDNIHDDISLYKAMVASVYLESFLFYSGFFYPLFLYGQGKMMNSGEIINLIIRDEQIHGLYISMLAKEIYEKQDAATQAELHSFAIDLLEKLYENEKGYTAYLYDPIDLTHEVLKFVRYNANKALQNLGFESHFEEEQVLSTVINGLSTKTKSHDFFSQKGNGYKKAIIEPIQDEDFIFE